MTEIILKVAIATVGITQLIKNLIPVELPTTVAKPVFTVLTIMVGTGIWFLQTKFPIDAIIAISGATIFYDTIYKRFEGLFKNEPTVQTPTDSLR